MLRSAGEQATNLTPKGMDRVLPKHSSLELFLSGLIGLVNPKLRGSSSGKTSDSSESSEIDLSLATAGSKVAFYNTALINH